MYHPSSYHLAQARVADLRRHAQRHTLTRAARDPGRRRPWVLRRTRAVPGTAPAAQRPAAKLCAEPAPDIRPDGMGSNATAGAAHRAR